jgi:hypothetical protein
MPDPRNAGSPIFENPATGEPDAGKPARPVRGGVDGKGPEGTSPAIYSTAGLFRNPDTASEF